MVWVDAGTVRLVDDLGTPTERVVATVQGFIRTGAWHYVWWVEGGRPKLTCDMANPLEEPPDLSPGMQEDVELQATEVWLRNSGVTFGRGYRGALYVEEDGTFRPFRQEGDRFLWGAP